MTTFHLVRHGKREHLVGDPGLTPDGRREAVLAAQAFASHTVTAIFTSPLRRAFETAIILADSLGMKANADERLRERMNWGDIHNQSFEAFAALWDQCCQDRTYAPPGGDSSVEAGRRLEAFTRSMAQRFPGGAVIAVCHGGIIADFLLNVFSFDQLNAVHEAFRANPYCGAVIRECSITTVVLAEEAYYLERIGAMVLR